MVRISTSTRPRLRRLVCVVVVILVLWISTRIINLTHQSQQQLNYSATSTTSMYPPGFNYSNSKLCPENGKNVKLLIMITTPPSSTHEENRNIIRNTWRHLTLSPSGRQDIVVGFMMGIEDMEKAEHNKRVNFTIKPEMNLFEDIIIGNFVDSYDNLTLKTLSILEWALTFCSQSKYLLKTDDDIWINIPKLLNFTDSLDNGRDIHLKIYGFSFSKAEPNRDPAYKYFVSRDEYPQEYYPDYVSGGAYLLPQDTWQSLYWEGLQTKFFKMEDVYFTGIVASKLGIQRVNATNLLMIFGKHLKWNDAEINTKVATTLTVSSEKISHLNHIWNAYKSSGCYANYTKGNNCQTELFAKALFQAQKSVLLYIGMSTLTVLSLAFVVLSLYLLTN